MTNLLQTLRSCRQFWQDPATTTHCSQTVAFIERHPDAFFRNQWLGHLTGSALIINANATQVLLTHHLKLNKWLQLGGHADGDTNILRVAFNEAREESGLSTFQGLSPRADEMIPFDVDVHLIPQRKNEPEHYHYDLRYLLIADDSLPLTVPEAEAHDVKWLSWDEARALTTEESMIRQFDKVKEWYEGQHPQHIFDLIPGSDILSGQVYQ